MKLLTAQEFRQVKELFEQHALDFYQHLKFFSGVEHDHTRPYWLYHSLVDHTVKYTIVPTRESREEIGINFFFSKRVINYWLVLPEYIWLVETDLSELIRLLREHRLHD